MTTVVRSAASEWKTGHLAVSDTAVRLPSYQAYHKVSVRNLSTSAESIFVATNEGGAATGFELAPGDTLDIEIDNSGKIWAIAPDAGSNTLCWMAV